MEKSSGPQSGDRDTRAGAGKTGKLPRILTVASVLAATIGCDQVTKTLARQFLAHSPPHRFLEGALVLVYAENPGAFLGLGAGWPPEARLVIFTFLCLSLVCLLLFYTLRDSALGLRATVALSLFAGGGVGNLLDRILRDGRVTDFLNVGLGQLRTGIFNLADFFTLSGCALLLLARLAGRGRS